MSELYPVNVDPNDAQVQKLVSFFRGSYNRILGEIKGATNFTVAQRKQVLKQIDKILTDLTGEVQDYVDKTMPGYYKEGADYAVKQLKNVKADVEVTTGFSKLHREAIIALVDDTMLSYANSINGIRRNVGALLGKVTRQLVTEEIAHGVVTGEARRKVTERIKGIIADQGIHALSDRAGKKWQLDNYAEMVYRTKVVEARNLGLTNRMVENGFDLVQVSAHSGSCKLCAPWEGKILSLTGASKGYTMLETATRAGLFHPNCRHAINGITPSLARDTKAYDPNQGKYV